MIVPRKSCARYANGYSYRSATMGSTRIARRQDANEGVLLAIERQRAPDRIRVSAEL
jgi:hypothetical protein